MKALFISDIHGRVEPSLRMMAIAAKIMPDKIFYLGDYLYNGPRNGVPEDYDPAQVASMLNEFADISIGVKGNCDSRVDQVLLKFPMSSDFYSTQFNGLRIDLLHGDILDDPSIDIRRGDLLVSGHTHIYNLFKKDSIIYFNPGSISFPKQDNPPTYGYMDDKVIEVRKLSDDTPLISFLLH